MKDFEKTSTLDNLIDTTLTNLKIITETKTIFGEQIIAPDGTIIIPISKATIGFVVGGGEYSDLSTRRVGVSYPMAGGSGGGISLVPIGFLINTNNQIRYISTSESNYQKIVENVANITESIFKNISKKKEKDKNEQNKK
jgi:sporulation protein YtfJ